MLVVPTGVLAAITCHWGVKAKWLPPGCELIGAALHAGLYLLLLEAPRKLLQPDRAQKSYSEVGHGKRCWLQRGFFFRRASGGLNLRSSQQASPQMAGFKHAVVSPKACAKWRGIAQLAVAGTGIQREIANIALGIIHDCSFARFSHTVFDVFVPCLSRPSIPSAHAFVPLTPLGP